jgi:dGTPase
MLQNFSQNQPPLAPYACHPSQSRGRCHAEEESPNRTVFQRDRDRIIHSVAFRRLEYKTQVFVNHEGDHYRTRLTHTLEVAQLARSMARSLALNEDLAEALALAHDLGHPPFGHAGEDGLREAMKDYGGFDHNAQTIRQIAVLEQRYAGFNGLNLTWETLEGVAKHNGPVKNPHEMLTLCNRDFDLDLNTYASAEAQIASLSDDIAYFNHDIDDGLRAGLFEIEDLLPLPLVGECFAEVARKYPNLSRPRFVSEAVRRLINAMVMDLLQETADNLKKHEIKTVADIRNLGKPVAMFSPAMQSAHRQLRKFLMESMYRHYKVNRMTSKARRVVTELFAFFMEEPECLPPQWQKLAASGEVKERAGVIADYIAGMTDRYAMQEHHRLFNLSAREAMV